MKTPRTETKGSAKSASKTREPTRVRDAERTKKRLLDAAEAVFAKNGLENASTEEIARRAGVSKTMLFYYFQNKEQLYITVLRRLIDAVVDPQRAQEIEAMESPQALRTIVLDYFDIHHNRPTYAELLLREVMTYGGKYLQKLRFDLPFVGQLVRVLRKGAAEGVFRSVDPLMTTLSIMGMVKVLFTHREAVERLLDRDILTPQSIPEWRDHIVDLLLNGVAACPRDQEPPTADA